MSDKYEDLSLGNPVGLRLRHAVETRWDEWTNLLSSSGVYKLMVKDGFTGTLEEAAQNTWINTIWACGVERSRVAEEGDFHQSPPEIWLLNCWLDSLLTET